MISMQRATTAFRQNYRLILSILALLSIGIAIAGTWLISHTRFEVVGVTLQQVGIAAFLASTVSVALAEYSRRLRSESLRDEVTGLIAELRSMIDDPSKIAGVEVLTNIREAGVVGYYPDRKGAATEALRREFKSLLSTDEQIVIRILGDTLRVFFHSGIDFTQEIYQLVLRKPNLRFEVLILNPMSFNAVCRSQAETVTQFVSIDDYRARSALYQDSVLTAKAVASFNEQARTAHGRDAIELRFYDLANTCFLVQFPSLCYSSQYLFADEGAQVHTVRVPLVLYGRESVAYQRLKWHFEYIWHNSGAEPSAVVHTAWPVVKRPSIVTP